MLESTPRGAAANKITTGHAQAGGVKHQMNPPCQRSVGVGHRPRPRCLALGAVTTFSTVSRARLRRAGPDGPGREQPGRAQAVEKERAARVTRRRQLGFNLGSRRCGAAAFRRALWAEARQARRLPRTAPQVTGRCGPRRIPLPRPPAPRPGRRAHARCADSREDVTTTGRNAAHCPG